MDFSVYELNEDGFLSEVYMVIGGFYVGISVDEVYFKFI